MAVSMRQRGRPPGVDQRGLEMIALRLFAERGYEATTIDEIAVAAGVSRRTFFRYFESKAGVLWRDFDLEVAAIRGQLALAPIELPVMEAVRRAVVAVNHYRVADLDELALRMRLIGSVPELQASAAVHYDAWERAVAQFAGSRLGCPADDLLPLAISRATLAACRAAYDTWTARADADLTVYLDAALLALSSGFAFS